VEYIVRKCADDELIKELIINTFFLNYKIFRMKTELKNEAEIIKEIAATTKITDVVYAAHQVGQKLGLESGSIGDFDLFRLFKSYIYDEKKRKKINLIIQRAIDIPDSAWDI
jgi:hypothetical protein